MAKIQSVILILADGARQDVFEKLLNEGELPNIQKHIVSRGSYVRMTTAFTSTTGPAYIPFLTGCYPGTANIPGIRWFDKNAYATKSLLNPHRYRSYCGWEGLFMNRDLRPEIQTIFDLTEDPINVFGPISRGLSPSNNKNKTLKAILLARAHWNGTYEPLDRAALQIFLDQDAKSEFQFLVFPAVDGISHNHTPTHKRVIEAYRFLDRAVGRIAGRLLANDRYDSTVIGICSDHGLTPTHTHFDIAEFMEKELDIPTLRYTNTLRLKPEASTQVSGNGMAHVYLKNGDWRRPCFYEDIIHMTKNVAGIFLSQPAIDLVITKTKDGWIRVDSTRGSALIQEAESVIRYKILSKDPFGFGPLPATMSFEEALEKTIDSDYPDALVQLVQIFRSERSGDIILSAKIGYDLRLKWEIPEHKSTHGSLHREHMMTPFCLSYPIGKKSLRSVDVFPTILKLLGKNIPPGIDGQAFL